MKKRLLALVASCAMLGSMGALAACNDNDNPPDGPGDTTTYLDTLKDGHYTYVFTAGGYTNPFFFNFYDDMAYFGMGAQVQGSLFTYTVTETDYAYSVWYTYEERTAGKANDDGRPTDEGLHDGTAKYTVTLTDYFDSTNVYTIGYDGSYIYANKGATALGYAEQMRFTHDTDANSSNKSYYDAEHTSGRVTTLKVYNSTDAECYVEIKHDKSYLDGMGDMEIEGKWTSTVSGGNTTYALTPDDNTDTAATLVVGSNGTGTYTPAGGTAVNVQKTVPTETPFEEVVLKGTHSQGNFAATLTLKADGVCTYVVEMPAGYGGTQTMNGTWTNEKATIVVGTDSLEITLTKSGDVWTGVNTTAAISLTSATPFEEVVLTGTHSQGNFAATLTLKADGVCTYVVEMPAGYGGTQTMNGTWTNEKATIVVGTDSLEITLTKSGDVWTGVNTTAAISLTSATQS